MNLRKLFGATAFEKFMYLDTGADKDEVLEKYRGKGYYWVEDKITNALAGAKVGLKSLLMEHGHNMDFVGNEAQLVKNWKDVYERITGEQS